MARPAPPASPGDRPGPATPGTRRRGRPRRDQGPAVTREAIVEAGLQSLRNHGLPGLALREVARRLGVTLPTIQHHFPTRDDLWRACVDTVLERPQPPVRERPTEIPGAGLAEFLRWQIDQAALSPGITAAMWHDPEAGAEDRMRYLAERLAPRVQAGRRVLDMAVDTGTLRAVDPSAVLALVGVGVNSLVNAPEALRRLFGIDLADPEVRERFAAQLSDILLHGLLCEP